MLSLRADRNCNEHFNKVFFGSFVFEFALYRKTDLQVYPVGALSLKFRDIQGVGVRV